MRSATARWPPGERRSSVTERLPLFSPAQYRLPPVRGQRPAGRIGSAAGRVDPDDLGAELGERHPAERRGDEG